VRDPSTAHVIHKHFCDEVARVVNGSHSFTCYPDDPTRSVKALKEAGWSSRSDFNPTRLTPPRYNDYTQSVTDRQTD